VTDFLPLLKARNLPFRNIRCLPLILGSNDVATVGDQSNPFYICLWTYERTFGSRPYIKRARVDSDNCSASNTGRLFGDQGKFNLSRPQPAASRPAVRLFRSQIAPSTWAALLKIWLGFPTHASGGTEANNLLNSVVATGADLRNVWARGCRHVLLISTGWSEAGRICHPSA